MSAPAGLVAGVVGGVTTVPTLPLILYFYALGMEKDEFVRSIAVTFLAYKLVQLVSLVTVGLLDGRLFGASLALTAVAEGALCLRRRVREPLPALGGHPPGLPVPGPLCAGVGGPRRRPAPRRPRGPL